VEFMDDGSRVDAGCDGGRRCLRGTGTRRWRTARRLSGMAGRPGRRAAVPGAAFAGASSRWRWRRRRAGGSSSRSSGRPARAFVWPSRPRRRRGAGPRSAPRAIAFGRSASSSLAKNTDADFKDLVRPAQLILLAAQPADLLALLDAQQLRPRATVCLRAAHPLAKRLGMDAQIVDDVRDRPVALQRQPHTALVDSSGYFSGRAMAAERLLPRGQNPRIASVNSARLN
jgi:hypothetical protein